MAEINTSFRKKLRKYGASDFDACYNCGSCTAVCSLADEKNSFPREMVRFSVLGLEDEIKSSLKPWLCYYCGECTTHCPRTAYPGELMMSLRRWLTSVYDWTGLAGLLYRSLSLSIVAFVFVAMAVLLFNIYEGSDLSAVMHLGHLFEILAISIVFAAILLPNIIRMWWFTILKPGHNAPLKKYLSEFIELIIHMFTQKRILDCEANKIRWFEHLMLVIGYLGLLMTTVFLDWFSSSSLFVVVLGYILSGIVFTITLIFISDRIKMKKEVSKFSQTSDWLFVIWLFLMGLSAFCVRLFIDTGNLKNNEWIYLIHLIILVQWALIIVPFGKWTHFLYRSFAMYFAKITGQ